MTDKINLEPLRYGDPPPLSEAQIAVCEAYLGEYEWMRKILADNFGNEIAEEWLKGVFWSRLTGDSGYYKNVYARYGHLVK